MRALSILFFLVSLSTTSFASATSFAQTINPNQTVTNTSVWSLNLSNSTLGFQIFYPSLFVSGVCGIEIRADGVGSTASIRELYKSLTIENKYPTQSFKVLIPNDVTISIQFKASAADEYFVAGVNISTRDGGSLREAIEATLGKNRKVIVVGTTCLQ